MNHVPKSRRWVGAAALTALLVTGCSAPSAPPPAPVPPSGGGPAAPASADKPLMLKTSLPPTGRTDVWLDPAYSAGIGASRTFETAICGVHQGRALVTENGAISLVDVASGATVGTVPVPDCTRLVGDRLFYEKSGEFREHNLTSGTDRAIGAFPSLPSWFQGEQNGLLYFQSDTIDLGTTIIAVNPAGERVWERTAPAAEIWTCQLVNQAVGCGVTTSVGELGATSLHILDAATGADVRSVELPKSSMPAVGVNLAWFADGYAATDVLTTDKQRYMLDGTEVPSDPTVLSLDIIPHDGVVVPLKDTFRNLAESRPVTTVVDASGNAVAVANRDGSTSFIGGAHIADPPPFDGTSPGEQVVTAARDGSSVLVNDLKSMRIIAADGREVATLSGAPQVDIENGVIVVTQMTSTDVATAKRLVTVTLPA